MTTCVEKNFLRQNGFIVIVPEAPNLTETITEAPIPSINAGEAIQGTPMLDVAHPGEKITWNTFTVQFRLQEDLANYKEVYDWMMGFAHPHSLEKRYENEADGYRDITVQVMDNNQNASTKIILKDAYPIDLSEIPFDTKSDEEILITATFRYMYFDIDLATGNC